ncbi:hypothetical protein VTN31DRAFT_373 [Thermomyces dupontii]|uniref:uncharacterized protein n=1 Tax=Talaromyces thermophilus TaxID=28565 RepID=UPI0037444F9D
MRDQFRRSPDRPGLSMHSDKQSNGLPAKPFTPTLSPAFRTTNKSATPLTPRLAAGAYVTPKKQDRSDAVSGHAAHRDETGTPSSGYLSANVTPRSGTRSSRRDGVASSSENTPVGSQPDAPVVRSTLAVTAGYRRTERSPVRAAGKQESARPSRAKSDVLAMRSSRSNMTNDSLGTSPMFFHADDARSSVSSHDADSRSRPHSKHIGSTFIYADGTQDTDTQTDDSIDSTRRRSAGSTFQQGSGRNTSALSPRVRTTRPLSVEARLSGDNGLQPSPDIEEKNGSERSAQMPALSADTTLSVQCSSHRKASSIDSTPQRPSQDLGARRFTPSGSPHLPSAALGALQEQAQPLTPRLAGNASPSQAESRDSSHPLPHSPIKLDFSSHLGDGQAISARTERKILDLEISNSSLLAINRTLERELRKQNAELRRYRRLSRSGRLSMASSVRSASGGLSSLAETDDATSEMSIPSPEELSEDSDSDSFADDGTSSPNTIAEHDARHRANDEKRFMLDLAKHQQLLVDSQKLNQSIKRCLGWTEELIREGKKALEYNVRVSDVEIGGRVLAPDEVDHEISGSRGLLSPAANIEELAPEYINTEDVDVDSQE